MAYKLPPQPWPVNQGSGDVNNPYHISPMEADPQVRQPLKDPKFRIQGEEIFLFDLWAQERNQIIGPSVDYYMLDTTVNPFANVTGYPYPQPNPEGLPQVPTTTVDPLYNEPVSWAFKGPFKLPMFIEYPQKDVQVAEGGLTTHWDAMAWVSRKEFEDAQIPRPPQQGDIMQIWKTPFFKGYSTNDIIPIPNEGFYFDVTKAVEDGHLQDSSNFVGYVLTLTRRTEFTPERKITPP